ncbi:TfoX/Sxy family protein [Pelomonas sp. V22]|uniref:TfoX/Sxy family protein n=1 Tax=Pelomonas sp. V22 TaxID=2822139 RepID=UPI0024A9BA56|nr:TfoX/Sxy family protein [Pelomonas sp. V22]MDI4632988.1 TfoX/Sxy family protein [Pelomonas sp. V22]
MNARNEFVAHCTELLQLLGSVRSRRMFGGHGLYVDDFFIAIVAGDQLFLKTDEQTRSRFEAEGCTPFCFPQKDGELVSTSYFRPPEEALESPALLQPWARLALDAALRAAQAKTSKTPKKPKAAPKKALRG